MHELVKLGDGAWYPFGSGSGVARTVIVVPGRSGCSSKGAGALVALEDDFGDHRTHSLAPFGSSLQSSRLDPTEVYCRQDPLAWLKCGAVGSLAVPIL